MSNIISTPLRHVDPKTRLWHKHFTSSTAACPACNHPISLADPTSYELQSILPFNEHLSDKDEWNLVILCSKDEEDGWGCTEKIERGKKRLLLLYC